jgi:hypothetical protein
MLRCKRRTKLVFFKLLDNCAMLTIEEGEIEPPEIVENL